MEVDQYPGCAPSQTRSWRDDESFGLENNLLRCQWNLVGGKLSSNRIENKETKHALELKNGSIPKLKYGEGKDALELTRHELKEVRCLGEEKVEVEIEATSLGFRMIWSLELKHGNNVVFQTLRIKAMKELTLKGYTFIDDIVAGAEQVGEVSGSVVVSQDIFFGVEHPLADNWVGSEGQVTCALKLDDHLEEGECRSYSSIIGVSPSRQMRRAFLYYLERRRVHPYRQVLHYNNWYDVWLGKPMEERTTLAQCLETIEYFGKELVEKRNVKMDAYVWDDGWDDFNSLWDFHDGFPQGFKPLIKLAERYGTEQGVWMSPNGGYSMAKAKRINYGEPLGYEVNKNGYAMGGKKYFKAFQSVCKKMMDDQGVTFFKFDGMGEGGAGVQYFNGATEGLSKDIHSMLELSKGLHDHKADVYVSATVGTWSSPFWLNYVDSIWRQGMDSGHHGDGDSRQQWMNYRDKVTYERVVKAGPLYPLNSLMVHGILIGDRPGRAPAEMELNEKSVADEIWSFFASGTSLQELYVSPGVSTKEMLDCLGEAANWARKNESVLVDTHWVGGNPGEGEIYGWAARKDQHGFLTLRNPSKEDKCIELTLADVLEIDGVSHGDVTINKVFHNESILRAEGLSAEKKSTFQLKAFELIVLEVNF